MSSANLIETMPRVLAWVPSDVTLTQIHADYEGLLTSSLGYFLGRLIKAGDGRAEEISALLEGLGEASLRRFLTAPETSYRLFHCLDHPDGTANFIWTALDAENRRAAPVLGASGGAKWSALGEPCPEEGKEATTTELYVLGGRVPIDLDSPYALHISLIDGTHINPVQSMPPYAGVARSRSLSHVHDAQKVIKGVNTYIDDVVLSFTKVLILRYDPDNPHIFASSSSGYFVGRSTLINVHHETAEGAVTVNGVVHEAIHSILYMLEKKHAWILDDELYFDESARVTSPWTGANLLLRPFLQACFVWYGLLNFWSNPAVLTLLPHDDVLKMAGRAYHGFIKDSLVDKVNQWRNRIDEVVLTAIDAMQQTIDV